MTAQGIHLASRPTSTRIITAITQTVTPFSPILAYGQVLDVSVASTGSNRHSQDGLRLLCVLVNVSRLGDSIILD